jgi:hypothetical protein
MLHNATGDHDFLETARKLTDKYLELLSAQPAKAARAVKAAGGAAAVAAAAAPPAPPRDALVPQWDFDAPWHPEMDGPRDTSAAAVAALGMLYLAESEAAVGTAAAAGPQTIGPPAEAAAGEARPDSQASRGAAARYLDAAASTLRALAAPKYLAPAGGAGSFPALLKHGTGGFPLRNHVDVGLISGDYYLLAALNKCLTMPACVGHVGSA